MSYDAVPQTESTAPESIKLKEMNEEKEDPAVIDALVPTGPSVGEDTEERAKWGSKIDFLLSTIGFAVDLSNVFRFPYLCYRNGGGAFLIPYFVMLVVGSLPLFYLEVILGQYHRSGCLTIWKICPLFKGVGWAMCLINYYVAIYYNVVIAWGFYYVFASFASVLPWTLCDQSWNTPNCWAMGQNHTNSSGLNEAINYTADVLNASLAATAKSKFAKVSSAAEYFEYEVLKVQNSGGFENIGDPNWKLMLCLMLVFVILYFSLFKGVKSMGKAVWITAILPYVVLGVLLIRGVLLKGATEGILYFIKPDFNAVLKPAVWVDAAIQIFYSVGAGFGVHMAYSSYNDFHNNIYFDCMIASAVNSFTSLFSGFVVFAYLGYMAAEKEIAISAVVNDSPGLVFMVYPEALATLPGSQFWSVLFFLMLISLGLDSAFGALEAMITAIRDELRWFFKKWGKYERELLTLLFIVSIFICALPNICFGGIFVIHFLDNYGAGVTLLVALWVQNVASAWLYGTKELANCHEEMVGKKPNIYWIIMWKYITPVVLFAVICARLATLTNLTLDLNAGVYKYPPSALIAGAFIILSGVILVPIYMIVQFIRAKASSLRLRTALMITPLWEHDQILETGTVSRFKCKHWKSIR